MKELVDSKKKILVVHRFREHCTGGVPATGPGDPASPGGAPQIAVGKLTQF